VDELAVELSLPDMLHTNAPFNWRSGLRWQQLPSGSSIALQNYRKHLDVAAMAIGERDAGVNAYV